MADQRKAAAPKIVPIAEPKVFEPQSYEQVAAVDPFNKEKLTQALKRDGGKSVANSALVAPELARRKQALEAYPLDSHGHGGKHGACRKAGRSGQGEQPVVSGTTW